jgi:hypothetical protein
MDRRSRFSGLLRIIFVAGLAVLPGVTRAADEVADLKARLANAPHPWTEKIQRLTWEEYEATVRFWGERYRDRLAVEVAGRTAEGKAIYLLVVTDRSVSSDDKQVALVTATHSGAERSGGNAVLRLAEWLLGDDPRAAETRRRQVVLLMPIVNPYGWFTRESPFNSRGGDPYAMGRGKHWDLQQLAPKDPDRCPEVHAVLSVVDRYRPEVHVDSHGTAESYPGQTMFEITGSAYSNFTLRPWDWRVTEAMIAAGQAAGYGSERFEADAQRIFWSPELDPIARRTWLGRGFFYAAHYGYTKYHTMISAIEVGWEESGAARLRGLLEIGNAIWPGESTRGYPVGRALSFCGRIVTAWGTTATERRASRVELWQQQDAMVPALFYPQTDGRDTFLLAVGRKAAETVVADKKELLARLRSRSDVRAEMIEAFVDAGPEVKLYHDPFQASKLPELCGLKHGISLRLRIPYRNPELIDLRLNGRQLANSATDGFQRWHGDGFTQVQINVPPATSQHTDLYVVTCAYRPDVKRSTGWLPPREVLDRLGRK